MSSSAVRSVCNDKPLLLGVELKDFIEAESAIESVRSNTGGSGFEITSRCSIEGGDVMAFGLEDREGGEPPRNMDEEVGDDLRPCGWCRDSPSWEGNISVVAMVWVESHFMYKEE